MTAPGTVTRPPAHSVSWEEVRVLFCDGDGNLYPSEEPAFDASADVMNAFLGELGIPAGYTGEQLRLEHTGMNFRSTATLLCRRHGAVLEPDRLEHWVEVERQVVTEHLAATLRPDPGVHEPLRRLGRRYSLALVTSSALRRVDACVRATGLEELFPPSARFSAEDSLRRPRSKPDPAVYALAGRATGSAGTQGLAVEDSVPGVQSAVAAGFPVVGNLQFVPPEERAARGRALRDAGAALLVDSWTELVDYGGAS